MLPPADTWNGLGGSSHGEDRGKSQENRLDQGEKRMIPLMWQFSLLYR